MRIEATNAPLPSPRVRRRILTIVVLVVLQGFLLRGLTAVAAGVAGLPTALFWRALAEIVGIGEQALRIGIFGALQLTGVVLFVELAPTLTQLTGPVRTWSERVWYRNVPRRTSRVAAASASVLFTVLLGSLVLQPTLVPSTPAPFSWSQRLANLLGGQAASHAPAAVIAMARAVVEEPEGGQLPVEPDDFGTPLTAEAVPLIDRWDGPLLEAVEGDLDRFAQVKAFVWVESGGQQYAVSSSGCAGLLQFCVTTAQRAPFRDIFGVGQVSACACRSCQVPRPVQVTLETEPEAAEAPPAAFPCDPTDARFDAERSLRAGAAYLEELGELTEGNLLLMYVGYNSGPAVARTLVEQLPDPGSATIADLEPVLADTLRRWYGESAEERAQGLLERHLPKLAKAHARWSS